jgi:hypothetical protein
MTTTQQEKMPLPVKNTNEDLKNASYKINIAEQSSSMTSASDEF